MRKIQSLFVFIGTLVLLILNTKISHAQDIKYVTKEPAAFSLDPPADQINAAMTRNTVTITFYDLPVEPEAIRICLRTSLCVDNPTLSKSLRELPYNQTAPQLTRVGILGADLDRSGFLNNEGNELLTEGERTPEGFRTHTMTVCGDGGSKLKAGAECGPNNYFHAGKNYLVTLFVEQGKSYISVGQASFYVKHHTLNSLSAELEPPGTSPYQIRVKFETPKMPGGAQRNNYQIVVEGPGSKYKEERCTAFTDGPGLGSFSEIWPTSSSYNLVPDTYIIKINEAVNDGLRWINSNCEGGYTFATILCKLSGPRGDTPPNLKCQEKVDDPGKSDSTTSGPEKPEKMLDNPCRPGNGTGGTPTVSGYQESNRCTAFGTAIGPIHVDPANFITDIFSIALYIAGLGAFGLIVYSGFRLMTSRGNKEIIQASRETLTSAIIGILFIILALVILQLITVDILKIPGFTR